MNDASIKIKSKKPIYKRWWFWVIVVFLFFGMIGSLGDDENESAAAVMPSSANAESVNELSAKPDDEPEPTPTPTTVSADLTLSSGNYIAGIDFPEGKYDIVAVEGNGNVFSDNQFNGGINALMGVGSDDMYEKEYQNIKLPNGSKLCISSVTVQITCDAASGEPLTPRNQTLTDTVSLGSGNFVAGEDYPAGVYDIIATSGNGNVSTDNQLDGGINAIMGVNSGDMYEKEYKNIELNEGVTLTISGVKIDLIPSK